MAVLAVAVGADDSAPAPAVLGPEARTALARISSDSLRGHLSFLASDLLEGRDTPSRGLDLAAEYIAAQFRRAGLEAVGDDGYFQTANWLAADPNTSEFNLELRLGTDTVHVGKDRVSFAGSPPEKIELKRVGLFRLLATSADALSALRLQQVEGKAVVVDASDPRRVDRDRRPQAQQKYQAIMERLSALKAAAVLTFDRDNPAGAGLGRVRLIDPENRNGLRSVRLRTSGPPFITIHDARAAQLADALPADAADASLTLTLAAPEERPVKIRNVIGLLRGSDPELKETYALVTAHYDHLGVGPQGKGDTIYNGANDDGSGTVSVIELASALCTLSPRPKRSLVFLTFFGEEKGLLGSRFYARHPVFPIERTVADINLEQVGRTDSSEGPQVASASMTGIDFSDVGRIFQAAGEAEGVTVYKHPRNSDAYFGASDNQALADLGVPAHSLCTAYVYPDYHGVSDHWDKVDFANMAKIDRVVARGLLMIANDANPPQWNEANPRAARYLKARKQGQAAGPR